jgi:hypothetical protein
VKRDSARRRSERERQVGIDPEDEAGRWLQEHDPPQEQPPPKGLYKSKTLHRWRNKQQGS